MESTCYVEYLDNSVELPLGETIVGRDVGCRLRFNDPAVSRRHLRFVRRQDELFVEDLNSSNGTLVNGRRVTAPTRIASGDKIQVGSRELVLRVTDTEAPASSTLLLTELPFEAGPVMARVTKELPAVTLPPTNQQRCPQCGAAVKETDDECASCHFAWGGFRATSRTGVRHGVSRRRHDRLSLALQLVYVSSELEIEATTLDLSASGVFVCSQVLEPVGTRCRLTILVDGGPPLEIAGVVRRVVEHDDAYQDQPGLGVEFVGVGPTERTWLDLLIARQSPEPGE